MKLSSWLTCFPLALPFFFYAADAYKAYAAFNNCARDGWSCSNGLSDITYTCPRLQQDTRVWIWTARLPTEATTFTVRECANVEVHVDCTTGNRQHQLREFKVINVKNLKILPLTPRGLMLHDNGQSPQLPYKVYIENVTKISSYVGVFDKPSEECHYYSASFSNFTLVNVNFDNILPNLFNMKEKLEQVIFKNVVIGSIQSNAISILSNKVTVTNSTFPDVPSNGIFFEGKGEMTFANNTFGNIETNGLTIRSKSFEFKNNHVKEISTQGLNVLSFKIQITGNSFLHLDTRALEGVAPSYVPDIFEKASRFLYNFSANSIEDFSPGSLHPDWSDFFSSCTEIALQNNEFNCSCVSFRWLTMIDALGPKISKFKPFYDLYIINDNNTCRGLNQCSLKRVVQQITDICELKTNISVACTKSKAKEVTEIVDFVTENTTTALPVKEDHVSSMLHNVVETTTKHKQTQKPYYDSPSKKTASFFSHKSTSHSDNSGLLLTVVPLTLVIVAFFLAIVVWWSVKQRGKQIAAKVNENDYENVANDFRESGEHVNELYNIKNLS